ncbi:hypothetical protein AAG570_013966 [Ranatra chinensis]|uniref:C2H2-type domain-containing protein n=1 Tax=Ranatra chinensis TaxID=642074 RepID=A0ABD0YDR2_9HEMI
MGVFAGAEEGRHVCAKCGKSYVRVGGLMRHVKFECGVEPMFQCPACPHRTKQKVSLVKHINEMHHPEPVRFNCSICGFATKRKSNLTRHQFLIGWIVSRLGHVAECGGYKHRCSSCGREYAHQNSLQRHLRYECGKEPQFQCPYCSHKTKRKENLIPHIVQKHNTNVLVYRCHLCPYSNKYSGGGGNKCGNCGRQYAYHHGLQRHLRYECGKQPQFQCSYCPHRTKRKENLAQHIVQIHNPNVQLYRCHLCSYSSKKEPLLRTHLLLDH